MKNQRVYITRPAALITAFALISAVHFTTATAQGKSPAQKPAGGKTAPPPVKANYGKYDFSLTTLDGKEIRLSDYAGRVVLVNLWAPWCGPCKIEMPGFARLHEKYKDQGFEIISVAVQTNETAVRQYLEKFEMNWPVGMKDDVAKQYATYGLPDNYLFLPDGMMTRHFIGFTKEEVLEPLIQAGIKRIPAK